MHDVAADLRARTRALNEVSLKSDADYVMVWLQQNIRGHEHPAIEVALELANAMQKPVLVYHGVRYDYPYASARLTRFLAGASRAMGERLHERGITCRQMLQRGREHGKGMVYRLAERATCVIVDDHPTFVANVQSASFAASKTCACLAVDSTRLIPHSRLQGKLGTTRTFRAAHSALRDEWTHSCGNRKPAVRDPIAGLPDELITLADMDEEQLDAAVAALPIDQALPYTDDHPALAKVVAARVAAIDEAFVRDYQSARTNPTREHGATELSPYLHFGMVSPWEVVMQIHASGAPKSAQYKLLDELLTWREWSHWRMCEKPELLFYETLPTYARETFADHADDPRSELLAIEDVVHGRTGDRVYDAAQRHWLKTGWLHNNMRMYWAKQVMRFTLSAQTAWAACCYMNDRISYDGRDPATYVSMRWAFGEARPGYRDIPVYGRVMPKSAGPILKRPGVKDWVEHWSQINVPELDCSNFTERAELYGVSP